MLPERVQQQLVERYAVIEDLQERLPAAMSFGRKLAPLPEEDRTEANRVQGCTSRVWVIGEVRDGKCFFRLDADSALVKGLAAFLCEVYQGAAPEEVAAFESDLLETLHLTSQLSPTRVHGLQQVRRVLREFGAQAMNRA
jgi:cysteine desulfuration protein SufE